MAVSFASAVLALALLTVLPGPDMAVVTRVALAEGRAGAVRAGLGIVSGLLVWGLLTVAGLAALLAASATAYTVVRLAGAAYLVWLGVQALRSSRSGARIDPAHSSGPATAGAASGATAYRTGLLSKLLNPKIAVFYTGLLPNLVPPGAPHTITLVALVLVHAVLSLGWLALYAATLTRAAGTLQRPRVRRTLDRVTGFVLVGLGLRLATAGRH